MIQVLVNLISNAIKFSDAKATIRISARQDEQLLRVFVSDEGRGIPADKLEKVFARFEQVESSDASKKGGSGLGLSICKGLIEAHGGEIGLTSEVGKGSTFWFSLPLSPEA